MKFRISMPAGQLLARYLSVLSFSILTFAASSSALAAAILVSPVAFDFGDVPIGVTASQQVVTLTNTSSTTQTLNLAGGAAGAFGGTTNCGTTLAAGATCQLYYAYSPTAPGPLTGSTSLSVAGQNVSFSFQGNAIDPFLITPTSLDFGTVAPGGTSSPQTVTITNVSGATQTLSLAGGAAGVFGGTTTCGSSLAASASCQINYAFSPTADGVATGSTTLTVNGQNVSFAFSGIGGTTNASPFLISPRTLNFGNVASGATSSPQTVTITNVSGVAQTLSLAGGAAGLFGGTTNCGATLAAGASCQLFYAFSPTGVGSETGSTTLTVNGQNVSFSFVGSGIDAFLISPIGFDFGETELGLTSPFQTVDILNVSDITQDLNLAGGAAGLFGGTTNCGSSLAAGALCELFYAFTPTALGPVTGSTSLSVNGQTASFTFAGIGVAPQTSVPEPATLMLLGLGLACIGAIRQRG